MVSYCAFDLHSPNVKHFFQYLLTIFISSLEQCLFSSFAHSFNWLFVLSLLSCKSSIPDTTPLSDM